MPIFVECEFCGKKYRMGDDRAGMVLPCKDCGAEMEIPGRRRRGSAGRSSRGGRRQSSSNTGMWIAIGAGGGALFLLLIVGLIFAFSGGDDPQPDAGAKQEVAEADDNSRQENSFPQPSMIPRQPEPVNNAAGNQPGGNAENSFSNSAQNSFGGNNASNPITKPPSGRTLPPEIQKRLSGRNTGGQSRPGDPGFSGLVPATEQNELPQVKAPSRWRVKVDPPQEPLTIDPAGKVKVDIPGSSRNGDVLFPSTPSRFVALGVNSDRDDREIWSIHPKRKVGTIKGRQLSGNLTTLSPDGKYFAVKPTFSRDTIIVVDVKKGEPLGQIPLGDRGTFLRFLEFAGPERLVAIGNNNPLMVWKIPSGEPDREITIPDWYDVKTFAFSPGGRYLVLVDNNKSVLVYDLDTGEKAGEVDLPTYRDLGGLRAAGMAFSPDGKELAGVFDIGSNSKLLCWDVTNGRLNEDITFAAPLRDIVSWGTSYVGPALEWFPNRQRWLIFGQAIADREVRKVIWKLPGDDLRTQRRVLDDQRVMGAGADGKGRALVSLTLQEEQITKSADVIQSGGTMADTGLPPITRTDFSQVVEVDLNGAGGTWDVTTDPAPAPPETGLLPQSVQLKATSGYLGMLLLSRADAARAAVMYSTAEMNRFGRPVNLRTLRSQSASRNSKRTTKSAKPVWVDVYDLSQGQKIHTLELPFFSDLVAFSPDGKKALMRIAETQDRLDVWNVEDGTHVVAWRPYKDDPHGEKESASAAFQSKKVDAAAFVDNDHVLTISDRDRITLWELPACRAVYNIFKAGKPGLSPNGKFLVISNGKSFRFFDALTGEPRGDLPSVGTLGAAAFHPDGERFAVTFSDSLGYRLITWNLREGQIASEFPIPKTGKQMQWCGENHLLLDGTYLIDVKNKMFVWKYDLPKGTHSPVSPDERHWFVASKPGSSALYLAAAKLPDAQATSLLTDEELKPNFLLKPGDKISLQVNLNNPPGKQNFRQNVIGNLSGKFSANGITVASGQPTVVHVSMSRSSTGKTKEYKVIGGFGRSAGGGNFTISEEKVDCPIRIMQGARKIWEKPASFSNIGSFMVSIPEGKTGQQVATENMWNAASGYLLNFTPPAYVFPDGAENGLGTSALIPN